jgi:hypothetical protein
MRVIGTLRFYLELRLTTSALMPPNRSHFFGRRRYVPNLRHTLNSSRLASPLSFGCERRETPLGTRSIRAIRSANRPWNFSGPARGGLPLG